jgi:hypothetical protein
MGKLGKGTGVSSGNLLSYELTEGYRRAVQRGAREVAAKPVEPCVLDQPFEPQAHVASPYERQRWRSKKKRILEAVRRRKGFHLHAKGKKGQSSKPKGQAQKPINPGAIEIRGVRGRPSRKFLVAENPLAPRSW